MLKKGLGKGLGALITAKSEFSEVEEVNINTVEPAVDQPRKNFDNEKLSELAQSIKQHGIIQPIIVRKNKDKFEIITGERRWRAAKKLGIAKIPVIIKEYTDKQSMEIALIENIQREDLNAIEEAEAFERLIKEYKLKQEEIAEIVGKSRSAVANALRLNSLSKEIKQRVINGEISGGHARAILAIKNKKSQIESMEEIISKNLNVRDAENLIKKYNSEMKKTRKNKKTKNEQYYEIEENMKEKLGTKVKIQGGHKKGKIIIEYYSKEELDRIIELINDI